MVASKVPTLTQADIDKRLSAAAFKIAEYRKSFTKSVVDIGRELLAVKDILPHGEFTLWVDEHCGFTKMTASRYMAAFETFGTVKSNNLLLLEDSAMYLLSSCQPAVDQAKKLIESGKKVSHAKAKSLVAKFKVPKKVSPPPVEREPGDDTETEKDAAALKRTQGKPLATKAETKKAKAAWGVVVRYLKVTLKRTDLEDELERLTLAIEGTA